MHPTDVFIRIISYRGEARDEYGEVYGTYYGKDGEGIKVRLFTNQPSTKKGTKMEKPIFKSFALKFLKVGD